MTYRDHTVTPLTDNIDTYYTVHPQGPKDAKTAQAIDAVVDAALELLRELESDCIDCEGEPDDELGLPEQCPDSKRPCGHHCNHSWSHEVCCWCNKIWIGEDDGQA